jgi:Glycosyl hydrolase family 26
MPHVTPQISDKIRPVAVAVAIASILAALLCASATDPAAARSGKSRAQAPAAPLYWGAQVGDQLTGEAAPWDMNALFSFESLARKPVSISSFNSPFAECKGTDCRFINFPLTPLNNVRAHGAIPMFSWTSSATPEKAANQRPYRLVRIINGSLNAYIREMARAARDWGHPFFLRFNWEMNGFWFPWSEGLNGNKKGQFVKAWRQVHNIFEEEGADNVTWVWCPNVDFTRKLIPLHDVYPGDRYVDWTCLDGFNWGDRKDSAGWQNFNQVFHATYKRVLRIAPDKPMMIGEVASNERGGSKAAWIRNLLRIVPDKYRKIRALVWFDIKDRNTHWPIESSPKATKAFARWIQRGVYRPNEYGDLEGTKIIPPTWP